MTPPQTATIAAAPLATSVAIIEIVQDNGNHSPPADNSSPVLDTVQFGLWDNAYDSSGNVVTSADVTTDFISTDMRRFYFRVKDSAAAGSGRVTITWRTLYPSGAPEDDPSDATLTLMEVAPGVFASSAVMLVNEEDDINVATNSQLSAASGSPALREPRRRNESDHRLRKCGMFSKVEATYTPKASGKVSVRTPVFKTGGKRLAVQVFLLTNCFTAAELTTARAKVLNVCLPKITACYERLGIWFFTAVANGTAPASITTASGPIPYRIVEVNAPSGVPAANLPNLTQADLTLIGQTFPAIDVGLRLFFVKHLATNNPGDTYVLLNAAPTGINFTSWIETLHPAGLPYAAAHELGHSLTEGNRASHYKPPTSPAGNRLVEARNLMAAAHPATGENTRLWDHADLGGYNQYQSIITSRFIST